MYNSIQIFTDACGYMHEITHKRSLSIGNDVPKEWYTPGERECVCVCVRERKRERERERVGDCINN